MEDNFSPVLSDLDYNFNQEEEANLYDEVANKILEATDYYTKESGILVCKDKSELEIAKNILEKDYTVTVKPLGDSEYDLQYHLMFNKIEEDYEDLEFISNKGSNGTLVGDIGGVAESYEEPDEETECPYCGSKLKYYGGQGNYEMYKCGDCNQWLFLDKDNNFKTEDEVADDFYQEDLELDETAQIHDTLNPDLWEGEELKPEVKDKLLEIAHKFEDNLIESDIKLEVKDIVIVGSNSQYNYTDKSDIDLHLLADLSVYPNQEELAAKLYDARKSLWNDKYDPTIYGHPVEVYIEPYKGVVDESLLNEAVSKGIYSLFKGWISKGTKEDVNIPDISDQFEAWVKQSETCETIEDIDNYLDDIYKIRQDGLLSGGEFSEGNLLFKELRDNNILDNLKEKKIGLLNQEMSL